MQDGSARDIKDFLVQVDQADGNLDLSNLVSLALQIKSSLLLYGGISAGIVLLLMIICCCMRCKYRRDIDKTEAFIENEKKSV